MSRLYELKENYRQVADMLYEEEIDEQCILDTLESIEGKVVASLKNWGSYFNFVSEHKLLIIAIIVSIWCVSATAQNEIEMKKSRRLLDK